MVCVGLDPALDRMPAELWAKYAAQAPDLGDDEAVAACFQEFCTGIIDAVAGRGRLRQAAGGVLRAVRRSRVAGARSGHPLRPPL